MNICVIGGGGPTGKFGRDFCDRARDEGHNVYVLSHKNHKQTDHRQMWANFKNIENVLDTFKKLTADVECIDIFIYNSSPGTGPFPHNENHFKSTSAASIKGWHDTIDVYGVIPHLLCVTALNKMSSTSKLVFLVSGLAMNFDRDTWTEAVGYSAGKATQIFLMLALSVHNDRGAIATAIAPHFDYNNVGSYKSTFDNVYQYILNIDQQQNGKILRIQEINPKVDNSLSARLQKIGKPINKIL